MNYWQIQKRQCYVCMHRHNHSWRELNARPLAHHQCSPPEQQELGVSNQEVHMEHLQAKGLFEGSKLAGMSLPFNRRISFIFARSSWISFVKVFSSKLRHFSRTRRITAAIVCERGERNTRWAMIAQSCSIGQKSSIFGGNQKGSMWRSPWRVGIRFL